MSALTLTLSLILCTSSTSTPEPLFEFTALLSQPAKSSSFMNVTVLLSIEYLDVDAAVAPNTMQNERCQKISSIYKSISNVHVHESAYYGHMKQMQCMQIFGAFTRMKSVNHVV
jgi:hypothetical protein